MSVESDQQIFRCPAGCAAVGLAPEQKSNGAVHSSGSSSTPSSAAAPAPAQPAGPQEPPQQQAHQQQKQQQQEPQQQQQEQPKPSESPAEHKQPEAAPQQQQEEFQVRSAGSRSRWLFPYPGKVILRNRLLSLPVVRHNSPRYDFAPLARVRARPIEAADDSPAQDITVAAVLLSEYSDRHHRRLSLLGAPDLLAADAKLQQYSADDAELVVDQPDERSRGDGSALVDRMRVLLQQWKPESCLELRRASETVAAAEAASTDDDSADAAAVAPAPAAAAGRSRSTRTALERHAPAHFEPSPLPPAKRKRSRRRAGAAGATGSGVQTRARSTPRRQQLPDVGQDDDANKDDDVPSPEARPRPRKHAKSEPTVQPMQLPAAPAAATVPAAPADWTEQLRLLGAALGAAGQFGAAPPPAASPAVPLLPHLLSIQLQHPMPAHAAQSSASNAASHHCNGGGYVELQIERVRSQVLQRQLLQHQRLDVDGDASAQLAALSAIELVFKSQQHHQH